MDKPIEKKTWNSRKLGVLVTVAATAILVYFVFADVGKSSRAIDADRTSVARVSAGEFEEYVPIVGTVQPQTSVFLDLEEGGIVKDVYIEAGNPVRRGDLILSFTNALAQKQNIDSETRLLENLDRLRTSKISLTEKNLLLKEQLLDLNYEINEMEKTFERYEKLIAGSSPQISQQQYETTRDNLEYLRNKRDLLVERIRQESSLRDQQNEQIDQSIHLVNQSLRALAEIKESLQVRAPIDGFLSSMNAEVGQSFARGQRIGQIDQLDSFKVRAEVDQYYISKVASGQVGTFDFGGRSYRLAVNKVYSEVNNDAFQVDMEFIGEPADGIKRGQTLRIDLSLSKSDTTKMVSKGGFYRYTNGRWAYRISEDGARAERVEIVPGRQNPKYFEILEGLEVGDWIITSSYDSFGDVDVLNFMEPVKFEADSPRALAQEDRS